ncbi:MAG TPA: hypothetical protein VJ821_03915 [Anaerolineales bacterium]|nr:hypothetical protein [Anaerolineales bacterium]
MMTLDETTYLNAARGGGQEAFARWIDPYRKQPLHFPGCRLDPGHPKGDWIEW